MYLEKVLEQEDELREPLDRFHHQPKEVETVGGGDLLHLQEVGEGGLALGLRLGQLHRLVEVVDEVRVDLQHRRLGETRHENVPNFLLLKMSSVIGNDFSTAHTPTKKHLLSCRKAVSLFDLIPILQSRTVSKSGFQVNPPY